MRGGRRTYLLLALLVAVVGVLVGSPRSNASQYSHSAPEFDRVAMLRVALAYNLSSNAVDLTFPADSDDACRIAGVGALTFVGKDHNPWVVGPDGEAFRDSVVALLGKPNWPCEWLSSEAANAAVLGIPRVWGATLKPDFRRLRTGLRGADCRLVFNALDRYPEAALPPDRIHRKVTVAMGRDCRKTRN